MNDNFNYGYDNGYNNGYAGTYEDANNLTDRTYYGAITLMLLWGFAINWVLCKFCAGYFMNINYRVLLLGYIVCAFAGVMINKIAKSWPVSFIGYNLVVLPIGVVLSVLLQYYNPLIIQYAFLGTALITGIMTVLAFIYPTAFIGIGRVLGVSLLITIIVEFILTLLGLSIGAIDYIVVGIFALYIGYDLSKAQMRPRTMKDAVSVAFELYLDIINIFIRLIEIFGRKSN